jgi:hypothetical protein
MRTVQLVIPEVIKLQDKLCRESPDTEKSENYYAYALCI